MADTLKSTASARVTTSATAFLTRGASNDLVAKKIRLHNTSTSAVTVNVWVAPNNGGAVRTPADDDVYQLAKISVAPDDTVYVPLDDKLTAENDTIQLLASTTNVVNAVVTYIEES